MSSKLNIIAGLFEAFAFETITVNTVQRLTLATYTESNTVRAKRAVITAESATMRYRYDGGIPTASVGHLLTPQQSLPLLGNLNMDNFRIIKTGTTNGKISVTYEK